MESSNDAAAAETCSQSIRFANQPFLKDQSKYLCAVTRFSVPLVEVPTIDATSFRIQRWSDADYGHYLVNIVNQPAAGDALKEEFFEFLTLQGFEGGGVVNVAGLPTPFPSTRQDDIQIPACFSFHEFMKRIQNALQAPTVARYDTNLPAQFVAGHRAAGDAVVNVTGQQVNVQNQLGTRTIPFSERIKMSLTADMRFQIMVCDDIYNDHIYVQLSQGMFRMLQFQTSAGVPLLATHAGYRFHALKFASNTTHLTLADQQATLGTTVNAIRNELNQRGTQVGQNGIPNVVGRLESDFISTDATRWAPRFVVHTAHMSCADATRIREIIFTSDMAVKSEGNVGASYKRFLCDYQVFNNTKFSYELDSGSNQDPYSSLTPNIANSSTVTEELPSHRIYVSNNASAGRWQELIVPSPLWECEVRAQVRCWNYEHNRYDIEEIPLPAGMEYSVKIVFVSRDNHVVSFAEKPNEFHP